MARYPCHQAVLQLPGDPPDTLSPSQSILASGEDARSRLCRPGLRFWFWQPVRARHSQLVFTLTRAREAQGVGTILMNQRVSVYTDFSEKVRQKPGTKTDAFRASGRDSHPWEKSAVCGRPKQPALLLHIPSRRAWPSVRRCNPPNSSQAATAKRVPRPSLCV